MSYRVRQVLVLWNEVAVVAYAVLTVPLATHALDVSVAEEDRPWRNLYCSHHKCLSQELLLWTTVVHIEVGT